MAEPAVLPPPHIPSQILFEGAQELLGKAELQHLLERCHPITTPLNGSGAARKPFDLQPDQLVQILEDVYGVSGGQGLALRLGRTAFKYGLKRLGQQAGLDTVEYRFLPAQRRLETGLAALAWIVNQEFGDDVQLIDDGAAWLWRSENCPVCRDRKSERPCCTLTVGMIQAFAGWATGGQFYRVVETACRAMGEAVCVFRIEKKPLD